MFCRLFIIANINDRKEMRSRLKNTLIMEEHRQLKIISAIIGEGREDVACMKIQAEAGKDLRESGDIQGEMASQELSAPPNSM